MIDNSIIKQCLASNLGMTALAGFEYLPAVVYEILMFSNQGLRYTLGNVYVNVARYNCTKPVNIERGLRYYKESLRKNIDLESLFGVKIGKRYTNQEFIKNVMDMLKKEGAF